MTSEQKFPIGWLALIADLRLTLMREFPGLPVLEMNGDRGWLHVRCDDHDLAPAERTRLDRMIQVFVTRSLATCMSCGCGHGRDREGRREVTCDACEAGSDMGSAPSEVDLESAPLIEGWELQGATFFGKRQQIHGWFSGIRELASAITGTRRLSLRSMRASRRAGRVAKRASTGSAAATVRPSERSVSRHTG